MDHYLGEFHVYITEEKKLSKNTAGAYERDLIHYFSYLGNDSSVILHIKKAEALTYLLHLQREGRAPSTISRAIASIRAYYQYLVKRGIVNENPVIMLEAPKIQRKLPKVITLEEVDMLLNAPNTDTIKGCRDKAMLELLYASGIRVTELIELELSDVHLGMEIVNCRNADKLRTIPLGRQSVKALSEYIHKARNNMIKNEDETALFVNCNGERLTRQGFWKIIKIYASETGIKKDITPQILRHSFATHLYENGADLQSIKEMLGHKDLSTTQIYSKVSENKLREVYLKAHPRA